MLWVDLVLGLDLFYIYIVPYDTFRLGRKKSNNCVMFEINIIVVPDFLPSSLRRVSRVIGEIWWNEDINQTGGL